MAYVSHSKIRSVSFQIETSSLTSVEDLVTEKKLYQVAFDALKTLNMWELN